MSDDCDMQSGSVTLQHGTDGFNSGWSILMDFLKCWKVRALLHFMTAAGHTAGRVPARLTALH